MRGSSLNKPVPQEVLSLFYVVGEAVCAVQHMEDALSHSITLKKDAKFPFRIPKAEADRALERYRSLTLGRAVEIVKRERLYSTQLLQELQEFLNERNWLVHKSIAHGRDDWNLDRPGVDLFRRIKGISIQAQRIQLAIEEEMVNFSEANGVDMTQVRAEIKKQSLENRMLRDAE
jgi:hypothetical protein